ncbi:PLD-like domain-containing protein [Anaerobranca californiensis DSM 14826]|jgi:superfamily II DNA or RNA helicase|uniref:PLD-like domain-containing protein n=1 Tax=Anaerobranca californiensis DSM 14826 TaxID=1120989 RepID=A0A1M6PBP8_9FIRM|nr:DEAD/DEAH box helicase family protein [Anaerobranca californiensis]SHK05347.1 PLD-like domain-containing protein [Anaerobranca californiensis DSM 14826]
MVKLSNEKLEKKNLVEIADAYESLEKIYRGFLSEKGVNIVKCFTGYSDIFLTELKKSFSKSREINLIVAFLMESGVRLILDDLLLAKNNGAKIKIITGRYLNLTEPSAIYLLKDRLGDYVDIRFYSNENISFHPKAYIFEYEDGGDIFIGSSNISESALVSGVEWNYRLEKTTNPGDFAEFKEAFKMIYKNNSIKVDDKTLKEYSLKWRKPKVFLEKDSESKVVDFYQPKGAQIEALYQLKKSRLEGYNKGLVVAATGIGKTYLAAFDSKGFNKILFVAHREEILKQSAETFNNVRPYDKIGFFTGEKKDLDCDILFASVQTLGKEEYLNDEYFHKNYFDYIVIDEFHHAVSSRYRNIINYFQPKFLLGLTATPERLDNKDIFALCDYNVVYELRLKDAINKGYLVPFHYYGIYDETDFSKIPIVNGKYNERELEEVLMLNKRAELILKNYLKYEGQRTIAFCSSKNHAEYMAKYFNEQKVAACAVYSGEQGDYTLNRREAIEKFKKGDIKVIFVVDMFNEGVDIPDIDLVMFLRPTESPTVFLQQLGRGLRKAANKNCLTVLDFIGNYKKANLIPFFLTGADYDIENIKKGKYIVNKEDFPEGCFIDFDFRIIDIFKKQGEELLNIEGIIYKEYLRVKEFLGYRPNRYELYKYIDDMIYSNMRKNSKLNIFNDYLGFLYKNKEFVQGEEILYNTIAHKFINFIEKTAMTKSYKIPILLAFYNNGNIKLTISPEDIYQSFKDFYSNPSNSIDMLRDKKTRDFKNWSKGQYLKLSRENPENFLLKTNGDLFFREGENLSLVPELKEFINNEFFIKHFKDGVEYRIIRYYKERYQNEGNYRIL